MRRNLFHGVNPRPSGLRPELKPRGASGSSDAFARGFLSFDLPVRQAQGPEALEGEPLDRWYGVGLFICHCRWGLRRNPAG